MVINPPSSAKRILLVAVIPAEILYFRFGSVPANQRILLLAPGVGPGSAKRRPIATYEHGPEGPSLDGGIKQLSYA